MMKFKGRYSINEKGFGLVESLVGLAMIAVAVLVYMMVIKNIGVQKKRTEDHIKEMSVVQSLRKLLLTSESCLLMLDTNKKAVPGAPFELILKAGPLVRHDLNYRIEGTPWVHVRSNFYGDQVLQSDLNVEFSMTNKRLPLGILYVETDINAKIKDCYSEKSPERRCQELGGEYIRASAQCKVSSEACPAGMFLLSNGPEKWVCF